MKIQQVQPNTTFKKKRFITQSMKENAKEILSKMNADSAKKNTEAFHKKHPVATTEIDIFDKATFYNENLPEKEERFFTINLDDGELFVDNFTGEIIEHSKSIFRTWKSLMRDVEKYLKYANKYYDNPNVVEKFFRELSKEQTKKTEFFMEPLNIY